MGNNILRNDRLDFGKGGSVAILYKTLRIPTHVYFRDVRDFSSLTLATIPNSSKNHVNIF